MLDECHIRKICISTKYYVDNYESIIQRSHCLLYNIDDYKNIKYNFSLKTRGK